MQHTFYNSGYNHPALLKAFEDPNDLRALVNRPALGVWYRTCGTGASEYPSPSSSGGPRWHLRLEGNAGGFARSRGRLARDL